jgi:hypothetical protein
MTDDEIELPGESELYDLFLEAQTKAAAVADQLGLSNEDLKKIEARWTVIGAKGSGNPEGHAMVSLARYVLTIRRVQQLAAMMKPGETMVPLVELADRFDKSGDNDA